MPDDLRGLDLEILQLVIGDRDIAPSLELVSFDDPVTIDGRAGGSSHRRSPAAAQCALPLPVENHLPTVFGEDFGNLRDLEHQVHGARHNRAPRHAATRMTPRSAIA
jgi:hypothetical protein